MGTQLDQMGGESNLGILEVGKENSRNNLCLKDVQHDTPGANGVASSFPSKGKVKSPEGAVCTKHKNGSEQELVRVLCIYFNSFQTEQSRTFTIRKGIMQLCSQ